MDGGVDGTVVECGLWVDVGSQVVDEEEEVEE